MTEKLNQSAIKAMRILESLYEDGFYGKTVREVAQATGISSATCWRFLRSLESAGWVFELPENEGKESRWRVTLKLAEIGHAYERYAHDRMQSMQREFRRVTGKELNA